MMHGNKKYGLTIPQSKIKKLVARSSVFGDDDEDEPINQANAVRKVGTDPILKRKTQLEIDKALAEDSSVYEYDAIYEKIQEKKLGNVPGGKSGKDKDKKPKYIENLLKTAELRKKEFDRRLERQVQKERDEEQGQFADKETFVTGAYRKKMQEMAEEEERERMQAELEAKLDVTKQKDLTGFYRHLLKQTTGEEKVPDVSNVKEEPTEKTSNTEVDFSADRDASNSDTDSSHSSPDSQRAGSVSHSQGSEPPDRSKNQSQDRHNNQSPNRHRSRSTSPEKPKQKKTKTYRQRSRTSDTESDGSKSAEREQNQSRKSKKNRHRSRTPEKYRHRSRTPEKSRHRSRTPEKSRNRYRSRTPEKSRHRHKSRTPEKSRHRHKSRTPEKYRHRSRTPEKYRHRSRTPKNNRKKSMTPDKKRYRSITPDRHRSKHSDSGKYQDYEDEDKSRKEKKSKDKKSNSRQSEKRYSERDDDGASSSRHTYGEVSDDHSRSSSASKEINKTSMNKNKSEMFDDVNELDTKRKLGDVVETDADSVSVKFPKRNVGDSFEDARARYLARKQDRCVAIAADPEEKC